MTNRISTDRVAAPASRLRFGHARADVTPPAGIYHRMWGAARHDRATGVHRPLFADVIVFRPLEPAPDSRDLVRVQLDLVGLVHAHHQTLVDAVRAVYGAAGAAGGVDVDVDVAVTYSHTHAAGWLSPDRAALPGGDLIAPYLLDLARRVGDAVTRACAAVRPATITYAAGWSGMAANRDYWDPVYGGFTCGFNPDAPADGTVLVGRVTAIPADGGRAETLATIVNYACHPTTLAWDNTLVSPDYPGALRETVEQATGAPCVFLQGACGDQGPRRGFVGDAEVADRNGRQVGYAALAALESLGPPETDFRYRGPVISGATIGTWDDAPFATERVRAAAAFRGGVFAAPLPMKPRPVAGALAEELATWWARQQRADAEGDVVAARDAGARAERARRWLARLEDLPVGPSYPLPFTVHVLGDAVWITCGGEPYSQLQTELRRRFPRHALVVSPLSGGLQVAYLLPRDRYGNGLYQEEPSILGPGCLEDLIEAIDARIRALV
jgi:hypothetical protein